MTINDYKITKGDNNTIIFTDNYGISYRVDINNYNLGEHTYIYENTRQTTNAYTTNPGYVYSQNITQGNSIGVTFPESLVQSSSNASTGKYHTTEQFRSVAADSTKQFMNNLPDLIGKVNGNTNTVTTISNNTAPNYTVVSRGWSGGTQPAVELAAANGSSVAVMIDPNRSGSNGQGLEQPTEELYQALKKNGTVIVSVKGYSSVSDIATYTERGAIDNGIPVIVVKNNSLENHTALENFASQTRVDAFLSGEISYEQYVSNCKAKGYDPNSVSLLRVTGYDENGKSITEELSFNDYSAGVGATPTVSFNEEDLKKNEGELSDFAAQYQGSGDTLASNLSFVSNSMSDLKGKVTSHTDINYTKGSDNEAGIVGAMYAATNYYGAVTNVLYGNLSAEADAVYAIANAIYKMDGCAAVIAEESLTDGISGLFNTSNFSSELEALKKTSGELVDTAKNAVMAGGRYEELSNLLTGNITSGSVGKISISSLESAINSVVPSLNEEVNKAQGLKASVDEFMSGIGSSNILQGGVWEDVKTNMSSYQNLLDCNTKAANYISDTIKTAMGAVADYINGSSEAINAVAGTEFGGIVSVGELDDSKLAEIKTTLTEIATQIDAIKSTITEMENAMVESCSTPVGTEAPSCTLVHKYSASDIQPYKDSLTKYETAKTALNAYASRLEGLAPLVESAQRMINDAINQVKNMYENPVTDTNGNQSFVADFKLDLSAYGLDSEKDYKKIVDDYYEKLNSKKKEDDTTEPTPDEKNPTDGGPTGDNPNKTEPPTEKETEKPTEKETESNTENNTEVSTNTEPPSVESSEIQTEIETDVATEVIIETEPKPEQDDRIYHGQRRNEYVGYDEIEEPTVLEEIIEEVENPYYESEIKRPKPEIINISSSGDTVEEAPLKTMGIASGVGVALGAAALGTYAIIKNKDKEAEEEEDMGYEK